MKLELALFVLIAHATFAMKPYNFCKNTNKKCFGSYNHLNMYVEKCELEKCPEQFKYYCGENVCAKDKISCEQLDETIKVIEGIEIPYTFSLEMIKVKKYIEHFNECPLTKSYLKLGDICKNGKNCFYTETSDNKEIKKPITCPCLAFHSYHCGGLYCAANSIACDLFVSLDEKEKSMPYNKCQNDDIILKA